MYNTKSLYGLYFMSAKTNEDERVAKHTVKRNMMN